MSELQLGGDIRNALSHLALVGLAAILDDAGVAGVRVGWSDAFDPRPVVSAPDLGWPRGAEIVHAHAARHVEADDWTAARTAAGSAGLMSPRIAPRQDDVAWRDHAVARRAVIDREMRREAWLDLRFIGSLGEPAYWRVNPDEGATRWEMTPRNHGQEFVGGRLHPLAQHVAARPVATIVTGLTGASTNDELGKDKVDSRTATGLASPGPTDNAVAWCALWGISHFPVIPQAARASRTAGQLPAPPGAARDRSGWFYVPVPASPMTLPRLRSIIVSDQLAEVAGMAGESAAETDRLDDAAACAWLSDRNVGAVVRFPVDVDRSGKTPDRRALLGAVLSVRML